VLVRQPFLKPGFYGDSRNGLRQITADDLKRYRDDTNKALSSGLAVPLLNEHCAPDDLDSDSAESVRTSGWLRKLSIDRGGNLCHETDVADKAIAGKIKDGTIRFVSPQLNPDFAKNGQSYGAIVRHIALTPKPVNPEQGEMEVLALSESDKKQPFTVSLESYKGAKMPKAKKTPPKDDPKQMAEEEELASESPPADELETADTTTTEGVGGIDRTALVDQLVAQFGLVLPDGVDLGSDDAIDFLLVAIANAMKEEAAPAEEMPMEPIEEETPELAQFSESQQAIIGPLLARLDAAEKREQARVTQQAKTNLALQIAGAGLPPAMTKRLKSIASAAQFSEDGKEEGRLTVGNVLAILKDTVPPNILQLAEGATLEAETETEDHPEGGDFYQDGHGRRPYTQQEAAQLAEESQPRKFGGTPDPTTTIEHVHVAEETPPAAPRKRGRPKGSKNKT